MKKIGETIRFAATDISNHLSCCYLTAKFTGSGLRRPFRAPDLIVIQQRGLDHERAYLAHLSNFEAEPYRVLDFTAYYRAMRGRLKSAASKEQQTYPEPNEHCDVCRWWSDCDRQRRTDDHLSLAAGITRLQRKQLVE